MTSASPHPRALTAAQFHCGTALSSRPDILEWMRDALSSADEDGCLEFRELPSWWTAMILIHFMFFQGWVTRRDGLQGGPWTITPAGRAALSPKPSEIDT